MEFPKKVILVDVKDNFTLLNYMDFSLYGTMDYIYEDYIAYLENINFVLKYCSIVNLQSYFDSYNRYIPTITFGKFTRLAGNQKSEKAHGLQVKADKLGLNKKMAAATIGTRMITSGGAGFGAAVLIAGVAATALALPTGGISVIVLCGLGSAIAGKVIDLPQAAVLGVMRKSYLLNNVPLEHFKPIDNGFTPEEQKNELKQNCLGTLLRYTYVYYRNANEYEDGVLESGKLLHPQTQKFGISDPSYPFYFYTKKLIEAYYYCYKSRLLYSGLVNGLQSIYREIYNINEELLKQRQELFNAFANKLTIQFEKTKPTLIKNASDGDEYKILKKEVYKEAIKRWVRNSTYYGGPQANLPYAPDKIVVPNSADRSTDIKPKLQGYFIAESCVDILKKRKEKQLFEIKVGDTISTYSTNWEKLLDHPNILLDNEFKPKAKKLKPNLYGKKGSEYFEEELKETFDDLVEKESGLAFYYFNKAIESFSSKVGDSLIYKMTAPIQNRWLKTPALVVGTSAAGILLNAGLGSLGNFIKADVFIKEAWKIAGKGLIPLGTTLSEVGITTAVEVFGADPFKDNFNKFYGGKRIKEIIDPNGDGTLKIKFANDFDPTTVKKGKKSKKTNLFGDMAYEASQLLELGLTSLGRAKTKLEKFKNKVEVLKNIQEPYSNDQFRKVMTNYYNISFELEETIKNLDAASIFTTSLGYSIYIKLKYFTKGVKDNYVPIIDVHFPQNELTFFPESDLENDPTTENT